MALSSPMAVVRILGIDPGSVNTGYGVIDMQGNHAACITFGIVKVQGEMLAARLQTIYAGLEQIITEYQPAEAAIEKVFMHQNADSALKLGQARGAAITACANRQRPVYEYTANQVKQATVGKGHAAKQQVQHMIRVLLCLPKSPPTDAADALAIALCHGHCRETVRRMPGVSGIRRGRWR